MALPRSRESQMRREVVSASRIARDGGSIRDRSGRRGSSGLHPRRQVRGHGGRSNGFSGDADVVGLKSDALRGLAKDGGKGLGSSGRRLAVHVEVESLETGDGDLYLHQHM